MDAYSFAYDAVVLTLVLGGYGWSIVLYTWVREDIRELRENHLRHLEERIERLENS